jgi:hypothetical protein
MSENRTFAKVEDGVVTDVRCAGSLEWIEANPDRYGDVSLWIETWQDNSQRGKYAGIGDLYDADLDEFVTPPQPDPVEDAPE